MRPLHHALTWQRPGERENLRHTTPTTWPEPSVPRHDVGTDISAEPDDHESSPPPPVLRDVYKKKEQEFVVLLQRVAQADATALAAFYDATKTLVYSLAMRLVHDHQVAEDVTIEVYMQVQRQAAQYNPHRGTPSAWLVTLTRSRAIDRLRAESTRQQREEPLENALLIAASTPTPEENSIATELRQVVQAALATLTPEQRQIIEIAYYAGLSHSEIAAQLGQPLGTVKTRLRTGLMTLRTLLYPLVKE